MKKWISIDGKFHDQVREKSHLIVEIEEAYACIASLSDIRFADECKGKLKSVPTENKLAILDCVAEMLAYGVFQETIIDLLEASKDATYLRFILNNIRTID